MGTSARRTRESAKVLKQEGLGKDARAQDGGGCDRDLALSWSDNMPGQVPTESLWFLWRAGRVKDPTGAGSRVRLASRHSHH